MAVFFRFLIKFKLEKMIFDFKKLTLKKANFSNLDNWKNFTSAERKFFSEIYTSLAPKNISNFI